MFSNSTQKKHWVFSDESILDKLKYESSQNYIIKFTEKFQDMAFTYYKRFYLVTSVIDFHPKEILVTCLFLACKVDEYNLTLPQFLSNIKGDKKKLAEVIISHEMKIIERLKFQMIVHTPYRPLEGFFIDIKTRYPLLKDPDKLRIGSGMFLDALLFTNACFLFTPSQIALTSLVVSSQKIGEDLTNYVELLYENSTLEDKSILQNSIKKIQELASSSVFSNSEKFYAIDKNPNIKIIESKLEKCRNPENNPDAPEFTRKIRIEMGLDDFPDD
ncbi:unnamed protein product [Gordionus sp. m RMFG-2023]